MIIKVFDGSLSLAVGISVAGAFFGGLGAYLYLRHQIHKNKAKFVIPAAEQVKKDIPDKYRFPEGEFAINVNMNCNYVLQQITIQNQINEESSEP